MNAADYDALLLSLQLAGVSTGLLLMLATPLAWWLAHTRSWVRSPVEAITALPLVLPPTVLGFYLLILMNPQSPAGRAWLQITGDSLTFSFAGLVLASILYSLPFAVQPLQATFESIGRRPLEAAASLRASPTDTFIHVVLPQSRRGMLTAAILSFAHTLGEFGVVLMVGGNIPGETRVISIAIYERVETLQYAEAHWLAAILLAFSFTVLLLVYSLNRQAMPHVA